MSPLLRWLVIERMTHLTVREWGGVCVNTESSINAPHAFTRPQANALLTAAREHPLANQHGTNILIDRHNKIIAGQMVGVIAAPGCSLEILPKFDDETKSRTPQYAIALYVCLMSPSALNSAMDRLQQWRDKLKAY